MEPQPNRDRRTAPRLEINQPALMTVLTDPPQSVPIVITDGHLEGMRIGLASRVFVNQAVKIEVGEFMMLGEICHCGPTQPGGHLPYSAGIVVNQILSGVSELQHLLDALQREEQTAVEKTRAILPLNGR